MNIGKPFATPSKKILVTECFVELTTGGDEETDR
jgi:hypothetical protein